MITKLFLETYPLLRKLHITYDKYYHDNYGNVKGSIYNLPKPALNMFCRVCNSMQTFNMENEFRHFSVDKITNHDPLEKVFEMRYICASCKKYRYIFYVEFGIDKKPSHKAEKFGGWIRKIGQLPPWEIDIDKNLEKVLGSDSDLYKKGLVNESQSYGIGAYSYFRRITENIIDELLESILPIIDPEDREKYREALEKVKETRATVKKIELIQDLLPVSLQPNGYNPLKSLHSALSDGLHNKMDDECLESADTIKTVLIYLLEEIRSRNEKASKFTEKMKKLLGEKTK